MGGIVSKVTDAVGLTDSKAGERAAGDIARGAGLTAEAQREQLAYLKETEALPLEMRNKFLPQLADIYSGGEGQQNLIDSAMNSPLYQQLIGNQQYGEDAILRNASATGGLRSGNANRALSEYNTRSTNEALTQTYGQQLQGIQGLAGINLNTDAIGNAIAAPGTTLGQGAIAAGQARQQQSQANMNVMGQLAGGGIAAFSDIRLKDNIQSKGKRNGHDWFSWNWSPQAKELGLEGKEEGVLAHLVYEYEPDAISVQDGLLMVNYDMLFGAQ